MQHILTSVVEELALDTTGKRVFNWAEIGFFNRWWQDQDDETRSKVKDLISARRWEFIGGGWVQNDEAVTRYNFFLKDTYFGPQQMNDIYRRFFLLSSATKRSLTNVSSGISGSLQSSE